MRVDVHQEAKGRWRSILPALGISADYLTNRHVPCPICKTPKKWFRFDDKEGSGSWICNRCTTGKMEAGNGVDLVMKVLGFSFLEAKDRILEHVGAAPYQAQASARAGDTERLRKLMQRTWDAAGAVHPSSAAAAYLRRRTGLTAFPHELRAHGRLYCTEYGAEPTHRPALLARVRDGDGRPVTIHRTYLTHDGLKAPIDKPKRLMASGPLPDVCAIQLAPIAETLGVAEGIETALSATVLFDTPCWSLISTALMAKWLPPPGVSKVVIYADRDDEYVGQQAAIALYQRLKLEGVAAEITMPDTHGEDWNDVLMRQLKHQNAAAS